VLLLIAVINKWLCGTILDTMLIPYVFILIYIGTAITFFEVTKWLSVKQNRAHWKEVFGFGWPRGLVAMIQTAFDFSWRRVSVLWTMCAVVGIIFMHLITLIKLSDAYKVAIESIKEDKEIIKRTGGIIQFATTVSGNVSKINVGVIGQEESFWVIARIDPTEEGYETIELEIKD
jgi:hypothetical protein